MSLEENKKVIENFVEYYNNLNLDYMMELLSDDIEFINISNDEITVSTKGKNEFKEVAQQANNIFLYREQKITSIEESNEMFFVDVDFTGKLAIDLPNGMKAGEELNLKGKSEYSFKDDKISRIVDIS